jgi:hypothetical protein
MEVQGRPLAPPVVLDHDADARSRCPALAARIWRRLALLHQSLAADELSSLSLRFSAASLLCLSLLPLVLIQSRGNNGDGWRLLRTTRRSVSPCAAGATLSCILGGGDTELSRPGVRIGVRGVRRPGVCIRVWCMPARCCMHVRVCLVLRQVVLVASANPLSLQFSCLKLCAL